MIKRFVRWLWCFGPCVWEIHKQGNVVNKDGVAVGGYYHLRCKTCGAMNRKSFSE